MKLIPLFLALCLATATRAQTATRPEADAIVGTWLVASQDGHVCITRNVQGGYGGTICWLKQPLDPTTGKPQLDKLNENPALRSRPVMGMLILRGFTYRGDNEWGGGKVYNAKDGKDYSCYLRVNPDGTLLVRGYVGVGWMGKTQTWTRLK